MRSHHRQPCYQLARPNGVPHGSARRNRPDQDLRQLPLRRRLLSPSLRDNMRKDVREFIPPASPSSRLPGTTASCAFTLPFSPDTTRWRRAAILDLRKLGIHL